MRDTDEVATVPTRRTVAPSRKPSGLRKLYLPSHHRHYLVVCSLHCDIAGLPARRRDDDVCEAGFVVRRRALRRLAASSTAAGRKAVRTLAAARRKRAAAERRLGAARSAGRLGARCGATASRGPRSDRARRGGRRRRGAEVRLVGLEGRSAGWRRRERPGVPMPPARADVDLAAGRHRRLERGRRAARELREATFPLYPLVPDPRDADHDAAGETIWFGVVPTGSADVDDAGDARFDDDHELRDPLLRAPPPGRVPARTAATAPARSTWSEPTEPYRLAPHFDLEGTRNRPVTVQLPDLDELQADASGSVPRQPAACGSVPARLRALVRVNNELDATPGRPRRADRSARSPSRSSRSSPCSSSSCSCRSW